MYLLYPCFLRKSLFFVLQVKAPAETLYAPGCIENTLLAGEKRVAFRANVNL